MVFSCPQFLRMAAALKRNEFVAENGVRSMADSHAFWVRTHTSHKMFSFLSFVVRLAVQHSAVRALHCTNCICGNSFPTFFCFSETKMNMTREMLCKSYNFHSNIDFYGFDEETRWCHRTNAVRMCSYEAKMHFRIWNRCSMFIDLQLNWKFIYVRWWPTLTFGNQDSNEGICVWACCVLCASDEHDLKLKSNVYVYHFESEK